MDRGQKHLRLVLPKRRQQEILAHCRSEWPHEACGLLTGLVTSRTGQDGAGQELEAVCTGVHPAPNVSESPADSYLIDPETQYSILTGFDRLESIAIGAYHSHPNGPATPSKRDLEMGFYPEWINLIVSFEGRRESLKAYRFSQTHFPQEIQITIADDEISG